MNMYVWKVIMGGCIVTILPRVLPITVISKMNLNPKIEEFLKYLPLSILASLIAVELFTNNNCISLKENLNEILAAIFTIIVGIKKKNLLITVAVGIVSVALLRLVF